MAKSYCLTVEVKSAQIENGLGYLIGFQLPNDDVTPDQLSEFSSWCDRVKDAVLQCGDEPFSPDAYTRKVAIAELMHALDDINRNFNIQIGNSGVVPAVQIHSTNPFDNKITIDFTPEQGNFRVTERGIADLERARVNEHGKMRIVDGNHQDFPFDDAAAPTAPPKKAHAFAPKF